MFHCGHYLYCSLAHLSGRESVLSTRSVGWLQLKYSQQQRPVPDDAEARRSLLEAAASVVPCLSVLSCPVLVTDEDTAVFCSVLRQLLQQLTYASRHSLMLEISDCQLSLCNKSSCLDYFSHSPCIDIALANR